MVSKLLLAWCLMSLCVVIHASGVTSAMVWIRRHPAMSRDFWVWTWLLIRLAGWMILLHLTEILLWALVYTWQDAMPDVQSAFYFSTVTYTTTGYGDLVLPEEWRIAGGVEALTGILMCGLSTGFFFAVVSRMLESRARADDPAQ
jgi:hypothetical protein